MKVPPLARLFEPAEMNEDFFSRPGALPRLANPWRNKLL
jgi:ligand-binding SRPBCC domain-containing protein